MVKIVVYKMSIMSAIRKSGNPFGDFRFRILVDDSNRIAFSMQLGLIICMIALDAFPLIHNARIGHLKSFRRLEVDIPGANRSHQQCMEINSLAHCTHLQSLRSGGDSELPHLLPSRVRSST